MRSEFECGPSRPGAHPTGIHRPGGASRRPVEVGVGGERGGDPLAGKPDPGRDGQLRDERSVGAHRTSLDVAPVIGVEVGQGLRETPYAATGRERELSVHGQAMDQRAGTAGHQLPYVLHHAPTGSLVIADEKADSELVVRPEITVDVVDEHQRAQSSTRPVPEDIEARGGDQGLRTCRRNREHAHECGRGPDLYRHLDRSSQDRMGGRVAHRCLSDVERVQQ